MRSKAVAAPHKKAADEINRQHRLARETASQAVDHALACGELLAQVKAELPHGSFLSWVLENCDFAVRTAQAYMRAAKDPNAQRVAHFNSLREALGYESKPKEKAEPAPATDPPARPPVAPPPPAPVPAPLDDEPEYTPDDAEEDAAIARAEAELAASLDKVLQSDDRLAAAHAELKRQAAEIAVLKISRDGFQNGQAEFARRLQAEQRKTASLQRKLDAAKSELDSLRERVAMMERD